jgi:hypothetical protein
VNKRRNRASAFQMELRDQLGETRFLIANAFTAM